MTAVGSTESGRVTHVCEVTIKRDELVVETP